MKAISRRELSRNSAKILDVVLATGEPVEVATRGRASVIILPKQETTTYERWVAQGLIRPGNGQSLAALPGGHSARTLDQMLADVESDH